MALGLPVSPLCDRSTHADFAKSQKGFIEFVVQPLIMQMEELANGEMIAVECGRRMTYNKYRWEELTREGYAPEVPEELRQMTTDAFVCIKTLVSLFAKGQKLVRVGGGGERITPQHPPAIGTEASLTHMLIDADGGGSHNSASDEANTSAGQERSSEDTPPSR